MLKTSRIDTCVAFDPSNGKIRHIHKEVTLEGAKMPSESEIETRVREFVVRNGRNVQDLKFAFVEDSRAQDKHYHVDPKSLKFVEVQRKSRTS
jgi:hypothetical protein